MPGAFSRGRRDHQRQPRVQRRRAGRDHTLRDQWTDGGIGRRSPSLRRLPLLRMDGQPQRRRDVLNHDPARDRAPIRSRSFRRRPQLVRGLGIRDARLPRMRRRRTACRLVARAPLRRRHARRTRGDHVAARRPHGHRARAVAERTRSLSRGHTGAVSRRREGAARAGGGNVVSDILISSMQEVHRWRGTPEQRAVRDRIRKFGQFAYFDEVLMHPDWRDRAVLDFGGSDGNLLRNDGCPIEQTNYWCLDVVNDAIDEGRRAFPDAHWAHYDRYNCSFNPGGIRDLPIPNLGIAFDFILAAPVFTHATLEQMRELSPQLRAQLAPGGALAFTFEEPPFEPW